MPMSDGKNKLQKIAFQLGSTFFRFAINPESMIDSRPHRTTAVKTKSRIVIEDFQSDIQTITISGSTGFNPTGRAEDRGIAKIKALKQFLSDYAEQGGNGNPDATDFYFHNFTNDESWVVVLSQEGVNYTQDVSSPLTYKYDIKFTVLRPANVPDDADVVNPVIGSPAPIYPGPGGPQNADPTQPNKPTPPSGGYTGTNGKPVTGTSPGNFTPDAGNSAAGKGVIFNQSTGSYQVTTQSSLVVNPQAPSATSYKYGQTALGYLTGYYARGLA
jgi:hypothetical protein